MYTRWTQHLKDNEEKELFRLKILSAREVLDHLRDLIEKDEMALDRSEMDQNIYNLDNWAYRQAHKNGVRQYINNMKLLLNLDQEDINDPKYT